MIELKNVTKLYRAPLGEPVRALDGVTLRVAPGSVLGVIGLNGAGKSTLLRLLLGYVRPTQGEATIAGLLPRVYAERHGVAYVPERVAIPGWWTVRGALRAYAMLSDLGDDAWDGVEAALGRLGLEPLAGRRVGRLSKGNVQRVAIAQALLGDRKLMVLDEATDGLDPVWIAELREIVAEWRAADPERTVVLASHNLPEVERVADAVLVLHAGKVRERIEDAGGEGGLEGRFLRLARRWEAA
jgi:ABC-2 type transport system ATP-binding protein